MRWWRSSDHWGPGPSDVTLNRLEPRRRHLPGEYRRIDLVITSVVVVRDTVGHLMGPNTAVGLLNAADWFDKAMSERLARRGFTRLTRSQSLVMANLLGGPARPAELARRLELSRQGVHQLLQGLTEMGLIEVVPDPDDRRATIVCPGPASEAFGHAAAEEHANIEHALAERIGVVDLEALRRIISIDWGPIPTHELSESSP